LFPLKEKEKRQKEKPHSLVPLRRFPSEEVKLGLSMPLLPALRSKILKRSCDCFSRIPSGSQNRMINFWATDKHLG
jgi:hypothetical protein